MSKITALISILTLCWCWDKESELPGAEMDFRLPHHPAGRRVGHVV